MIDIHSKLIDTFERKINKANDIRVICFFYISLLTQNASTIY